MTIEFEGFPAMARYQYPYLLYDSIDKEYISLSNAAVAPVDLEVEGKSTMSVTIPEELTPFLDYKPMNDFVDNHNGTGTWTAESSYRGSKRLTLQQISAMVMGGHAWEGYSEWFEVVLSPETLSDSKKGANATEVFIHEMVHQWWGALCKEILS